uniref:Ring finger protein 112 n=1 Tax=Pelusios castaneus TaxID=367368 RepID=A0A8C8RMU5_9SAUR
MVQFRFSRRKFGLGKQRAGCETVLQHLTRKRGDWSPGVQPTSCCIMGNKNNKQLTPPLSSKLTAKGVVEQLQEDVTCSICLDVLDDPVSIECGHNFCRVCLLAHWSRVSAWGYQCPECRAPCSRNRMTPDTRVKSLVEKIRELPCEEMPQGPWRTSPEQGPEVQPELGRPVQLVHLDEEGGLILDEEALSSCLEQGRVGDAPVCLVSIIGEQRRGKSFLLNYLLRRLRSLDVKDASWLGREEEPLEGFAWRVGTHSVTKGLWAWSQPFWVPSERGKVAVLLVDTEGSMDIARDMETGIKLSALSMLLGSYQILNVSSQLKDPDLDYLEMFLHVAEVVGEEYGLKPIQHLDLLVRDWSSSLVLGADGGKEYLSDVRQMLEAMSPVKHPKTLDALSRSSTRCYLMPFPGKGIMTGSQGCLRDMDEDFRDSLREYVGSLVGSAGRHIRRDRCGKLLTGTQLAARMKRFSDLMKKHCFGFSSPCQMKVAFHNQRVIDTTRRDHATFLKEKVDDSQNLIKCLKVMPSKMAEQFAERRRQLLWQCQTDLQMSALEKEDLVTELEAELTLEDQKFLETYGKRFKNFAIGVGAGVGVLVLGPLGAAGAGIAAAAIAAEAAVALGVAEAVAIGASAGAVVGTCVGGGVGGGVGGNIAKKDSERAKAASVGREEGDSAEDLSDDKPLI